LLELLTYNIHMTDKNKDTPFLPAKQENSILLDTIRRGYELPQAYLDTEISKATQKKDILPVLNLELLTGKRIEDFYVNIDPVRGVNILSTLQQLLDNPLNPYTKLLFSGFLGSGKTTELINLAHLLQGKYHVIIFSALKRLNTTDITIESLLFEIFEDVLHFISSYNMVDPANNDLKRIISKISDLCSISPPFFGTKNEDNKFRSSPENIQPLKRFFSNAKLEKRTGPSNITINDLIIECNKIFNDIKISTGKEIIILIDDLDKLPISKSLEIYISNASLLKKFQCKMVLTIPFLMFFSQNLPEIENIFVSGEIVPMIITKDKDNKAFPPGINKMIEILERRIDLSLFENQCYTQAIKYSGGAIRDFFRIVQRAAVIENTEMITEESMQKSIGYHKSIFASRIQESSDEPYIKIQEYLEILIDIYNGNHLNPQKNLTLFHLLRTGAVLLYPGPISYYDVHPLLGDFIANYKKQSQKQEISQTTKSSNGSHFIDEIENGYIDKIELSNFFCIDHIKIDNLKNKKEIYIVGENGEGKTIFLQGLLLALKGNHNGGEIINFIKQNPRRNYSLKAIDDQNQEYSFSEKKPGREFMAKNVFAYGVHRSRNDSDKADQYGYLTLVEYDGYLKNPVKWLQYLHHKEKAGEKPPINLDIAIQMLKSLLNENVEIEVSPDKVIFTERQTKVEFSQLADGYKSVLIWCCDLLEKLAKHQPQAKQSKDFKGIVLLDEIELFLHPRWKYKIARNLRHWFPLIQFVFSTHSTTVIQGASKDAVFYKVFKENGITKISQPVSKISGLMINTIVTSPLFDLSTAAAAAFEQDIPERLTSHIFNNDILNKITNPGDKKWIRSIYEEYTTGTGEKEYLLKNNLGTKEINRLLKILIDTGFKDALDTSSDFLYYMIHREIKNRVKNLGNITEDKILDLIKDELDKYESNPDYA